MKAYLHKKFSLEQSIYAIKQRLRISKRKTTTTTQFEAHFGRRCNTPISNITTKSNTNNLNYNKIFKHYLDEDTIPGRSYLTDTQWADTGMCSDVEIEKFFCAANTSVHEEQEKMKGGESSLMWSMWSEGISRPIPRSERSVQVKIARKLHAAQRQKKT